MRVTEPLPRSVDLVTRTIGWGFRDAWLTRIPVYRARPAGLPIMSIVRHDDAPAPLSPAPLLIAKG